VEFESINLTFPIDRVYRGIEFWNLHLETPYEMSIFPVLGRELTDAKR
jgi:hypothetical protein